jgi:cytochrome P450
MAVVNSVEKKHPHGPKGQSVSGCAKEFKESSFEFLIDLEKKFPEIARFKIFHLKLYHTSVPDHVKHVLQTNNKNYYKSTHYDELKLLLGEGLLTSEGDFWRKQRRMAQPGFHREKIAALCQTMVECTQEMAQEWQEYKDKEQEVDVLSEMMKLTLHIVGRTLLSTDVKNEAPKVGKAVSYLLYETNQRTLKAFNLPIWVPFKKNIKYNREKAILDKVVYDIISKRRASCKSHNDLLDMLMNAYDEDTGEKMSDRQLRDEVMTIFLAGHETTANALAWIWYLLSQNPEAEEKFHRELKTVLGGRLPGAQDIPQLKYTLQIIEEALRLYPPAWLIARRTLSPDRLGEYFIKKDANVLICPYIIHRKPEYWPDPEKFDPERFLPENAKDRHKFAYLPFGGGPRLCIGNNFALMEMQLILATLGQLFKPRLKEGFKIDVEPAITLRPKYGMVMNL